MKQHVISIGGGISSTYLLVDRVVSKYGKENVTAVICALANEHDDVWRLVSAVEQKYDISIKRIYGTAKHRTAYPIDIWDVFFFEGMMGNPFADPCSRTAKRELMAAWMQENFDPANTVLHVGITAGEIDRMMAIRQNWSRQGWTVEADLADEPELDREKQMELCEQAFGFVPLLYRIGMKHNNCSGFCIKAGKGQMARLLWFDRKLYLYHEKMELLHQQTFDHTSTIMRDEWTRNGKRGADSLTLRDFRLRMEAKWKTMLPGFDPFDGLDDMSGCKWCEAA